MSDVAMDEEQVSESIPPPPIDRLSLLPDELLHDIFDLAYSGDEPEGPLSKHLYPFYEEHLYRRVRLYSGVQFDDFFEAMTQKPEKGKWVRSLRFDDGIDFINYSPDDLQYLFSLLPNLLEIYISSSVRDRNLRSEKIFSLLSKVIHMTTDSSYGDSNVILGDFGALDLGRFHYLSSLSSLSTLNVLDWEEYDGTYFKWEDKKFQLPHLKNLQIKGDGAGYSTIKGLIDSCPALNSVHLHIDNGPDVMILSEAVSTLPSTLEDLTLGCGPERVLDEPTDHLLFRFTQLRSLDLDTSCYSETIHLLLSELPLLVSIRLGHGTISPFGFLSLVSGPTRLVNLKQICLDFEEGFVGGRTHFRIRAHRRGLPSLDNWRLPGDVYKGTENEEEEGYVPGLKELIKVAERNGVRIRGSIHGMLENTEGYWIEANNQAIVRICLDNSSERLARLRYVHARATRAGSCLPPLDFDSLERTHLELKNISSIDLPKRKWYIYSLMNVGGGDAMEEGPN